MAYVGSLNRPDFNAAQIMESKRKAAVYLTGWKTPLFSKLTKESSMIPVSDHEFTCFTRPRPSHSGMLWGYSGGSKGALANTDTDMYITNASTILKPGDILYLNGLQANIATEGNKTVAGEFVEVLSTLATNLATVKRTKRSGTALDNDGTGTADGLTYQLMGATEPLGGGTRIAKGLGKGDRKNYVRIFCEPFSVVQQIKDYYKLWPGDGIGEFNDQRDDAFSRMTDSIESMLFLGSKDKETDAAGRPVYDSGGLLYWLNQTDTEEDIVAWSAAADLVTGNGSSRIWNAEDNFNRTNIGLLMSRVFNEGGKTKFVFHGNRFIPIWANQFEDWIRAETSETDYGITITTHTVEGNKLKFVHAPILDAAHPTGAFIVDMDYFSMAKMMDISMRKPTHDPRSQAGSRTYDYDYIADLGVYPEYLKSHAIILNINDIA